MNNENEDEPKEAVRQHTVMIPPDLEPTSPNPLTAPPCGAGPVGQSGPAQPAAREVGIEAAKSPTSTSVPQYKPTVSRLPERITAREIQADRSNPDGCIASEVQR